MPTSLLMISRSLLTLASEQNILLEVFRRMLFPFLTLWWCSTHTMIKKTKGHKFQPICSLLKQLNVTCALCALFTSSWYPPPSFYHPLIDEEFHHSDAVLTTIDFFSVVIRGNGLEASWIGYVTFSKLIILMHVFPILIVIMAENTKC